MSWSVTIHFTVNDKTYPIIRESFMLTACMGRHGRHETQTARFQIRSKEAAQLFMTEQAPHLRAEVYEGQTVRFKGVIRASRNFSVYGNSEENMALEILDYTELLKIYPAKDEPLRDTNITSVINKIMSLAGLSGVTIHNEMTVSDSWDYFSISSRKYLCDTLESFLCEYGMDFRFDVDGMHIIPTTIATVPSNQITDIRGALNVSRDDSTYDGVEVSYKSQYKYANQEVYKLSKEFGDKKWWDLPIFYDYHTAYHTGLFYPDEPTAAQSEQHWDNAEMHDGVSTLPAGEGWASFSLDFEEEEILNVKVTKATASITANSVDVDTPSAGTVTIHESNLEQFRYSFPYSGKFKTISYGLISGAFGSSPAALVGWTINVKVTADVIVRGPASTVLVSSGARDTKKIELDYVNAGDLVRAYAEREAQRLKTSCFRYSFSSLTEYDVGRFYSLTDPVIGLNSTVRVISKEYDGEMMYSYICEGAGAVSILDIKPEGVSSSRDISAAGSALQIVLDAHPNGEERVLRAHAIGDVLDMEGFTYEWYLNGTVVKAGPSMTISSGFISGTNELKVVAIYGGDVGLNATFEFEYIEGGEGVQIEYALGTEADSPPPEFDGPIIWAGNGTYWDGNRAVLSQNPWSTESPTPKRGEYLWIRTR